MHLINKEKILAIIPARGGSKGVPGKNIKELNGKPLIAWTIEAAQRSNYLDRLILSSDCETIIHVAKTYGCEVPFIRDSRLAQDETPTMDVVFDAIDRCPGYEWIVLLQATSPLRNAHDIDNAIRHCMEHNARSCVSVCKAQENPHWMYTLNADGKMQALFKENTATRRQDLPTYYSLNGAIYIAQTEWLLKHRQFLNHETIAYVMPTERSIDVDTAFDFLYLELLLKCPDNVYSLQIKDNASIT